MEYILQNSSCHGGNWVMKLTNPKIKSAGTLIVFALQFILLTAVLNMIFYPKNSLSTSLLWDTEELIFPNMTICNPRIFDKEKVDELGLTDELLAYLYWPVSKEYSLELNEHILENYEKYEEELKGFNLTRNAMTDLAIK